MQNAIQSQVVYVGFWKRVLAGVVDFIVPAILLIPVVILFYHNGNYENPEEFIKIIAKYAEERNIFFIGLLVVFDGAYTILFWLWKSATPGKLLFKMKIVDKDTMQNLGFRNSLLRYIGYYASQGVIFIGGYLWVAFNKKKQGFHDLIANTIVISTKKS
jgi:uncharacterized RDD family membrane protein YckC